MRGRNMADMICPDLLSCSPPQLLGRFGSTRLSAPCTVHTWNLRFATAFHSPPRLYPFGRLHEGSPLPACCFSPTPLPPSGPFGSSLPASLRFCIACAGPIHVAFPLPDVDSEFPGRSSACTHPWDGVPQVQRACQHLPGRLTLALNPISVRSPLPALFYHCPPRIIVPGPLSLARLAVPSDLLEPSK
jgi:hypothetical protein